MTSTLRSTNLERDTVAESLPQLYVGSRAQESLHRILQALEDPARTRAWSMTGPYGSGKSTLALLIDAILGFDAVKRTQALHMVSATNPGLSARLEQAVSMVAFTTAGITARREPVATTIGRALSAAVARRWPDRRRAPKKLATLQSQQLGSADILDAIEELCDNGPLLLILDEFGKNLEHLVDSADTADDLFLLQELAELGAGTNGLPLYLITLQHLSFLDYASRTTDLQRREWAKIQGRFEDITLTPDIGDAVQLIGRSLDQTSVSPTDRKTIKRHAHAATHAWAERGLDCLVPGDEQMFGALYPLHPLTAVAAPLLAAQVGQHDRSVVGFVASDEPHTVTRFLASTTKRNKSCVMLPELYDYFLSSGRTTLFVSANASRWIEIDTRISEAHGLPDEDQDILKSVGLLNLIDSSGALRASKDAIIFALTNLGEATPPRRDLGRRIDSLVKRGFLVYRRFSDEYRIWQGSDVDLRARIDDVRSRCDDQMLIDLLRNHLPVAIAAGRHSQQTGMLRHFLTDVTAFGTQTVEAPSISTGADGLVVYHLGPHKSRPSVTGVLPIVIGTTDEADRVLGAGREVLALEELRRDSTLDAVARREVAERLGQATAELATVLAGAFNPARQGTRWRLLTAEPDEQGQRTTRLSARSMAGVVSEACQHTYRHTPTIRNEMLGRNQLTSQGAKARRELLTRMLTHAADENLGIDGYGPERAMYSGIVQYLGLHQLLADSNADDTNQLHQFGFIPPGKESSLAAVWTAMVTRLTTAKKHVTVSNILDELIAPPYGVKRGVAPVIFLAALIVHHEDVAVFEEGTYQPTLTPDMWERLVKAPNRFTVKSVATSRGQRKLVLQHLAEPLAVNDQAWARASQRNPSLVSITHALLVHVRGLTRYAIRTKRISSDAVAVREALLQAREPDDLLFHALPQAVGLEPITAGKGRAPADADEYVSRLTASVLEVADANTQLRRDVVAALARAFRLPNDLPVLRRDLAARTRGFADVLLEPRLKGLVNLTLNNELGDDDWLDPVAVNIARTPINDWDDATAEAFEHQAQEVARALDRISHLHQSAHLDAQATPFSAKLITLTTTDGHEERALVHTPQDIVESAEQLATSALTDARHALGPDGARILLATIAQQLLTSHPEPVATTPTTGQTTRMEARS